MVCLPDRQEHCLGLRDQLVGQLPGDLLVVEPLLHQLVQIVVEAARLDQVGNDDRVAWSPVAPRARLRATRSGSIESSQNLVPLAMRDFNGDDMVSPARGQGLNGAKKPQTSGQHNRIVAESPSTGGHMIRLAFGGVLPPGNMRQNRGKNPSAQEVFELVFRSRPFRSSLRARHYVRDSTHRKFVFLLALVVLFAGAGLPGSGRHRARRLDRGKPGRAGLLPRVPDITYFPNPIAHLSEALTIKNALWQHNVLGQTGVRSEHVGSLVVFAQSSAKAASLPAVMEAVWLSPEYASLAEAKRQLMLGPGASGSLDLWSTSGFPPAPPPIPALEGPIAGGHVGGQLNVMA